jgi:hypothetical protein
MDNRSNKEKPFRYLIFDWAVETRQDTARLIDACFLDYVHWYHANYPSQLMGLELEMLEKWWNDEVGLTAYIGDCRAA